MIDHSKVTGHGTSLTPNAPITPAYQIAQMKEDALARQMEEDRRRHMEGRLEIDSGLDRVPGWPPKEDDPSER